MGELTSLAPQGSLKAITHGYIVKYLCLDTPYGQIFALQAHFLSVHFQKGLAVGTS